jgi:outer membrane cobalamin receptor
MPALLALLAGAVAASPGSAPAQGPGTVTGTVVSSAGEAPLASVSVAVRRAADSVVVGGKITPADGRFSVSGLPPGRYLVQATLIGFTPWRQADVEISAAEPVADLGRIALTPSAVAIQGVTVQGARSPVTIAADRTIYQTREMPVAEGGVATDVLRTVPELEVDIEGKVSLRGTGVQIQLNGRRAPMQGEALANFLQQLPANRIERIEVIPNPSARYEAEGQGGIINIVLRENVDLGLSGNLSFNTSTRGQNGASARLSYQRGRVTLFGGSSMSLSSNRYENSDLRENRIADPVTFLQQRSNGVSEGRFGSGDLTAELKLSSKATLWTEMRGYRSDSESDGLTAYTLMNASRLPTERYDRGNLNDGAYLNGYFTTGFRHAFKPQRHELILEVRRSVGGNDSDGRSAKTPLAVDDGGAAGDPELTLTDRQEDNSETTVSGNYVQPLGELASIETGYQGTRRTTENDQLMSVFAPADASAPIASTPSSFDYTEQFHAFYLTANQRWGKLALQAGVRAELAETVLGLRLTGDEYANDYRSVFPSGNISYDFGGGRQLRLMYSKRVQRPYVFYLNPINPSVDPLNRQHGNPDLLPMYTHSVSADASWNGSFGTLRIAPYYRRTVDSWDQFKTVDEQGVSTVTWKNLSSMESYGSNFIAQVRQVGPLGGYLSMNAWREERDVSSLGLDAFEPKLRWSTNANATLRLPRGLMMQGSASYSPARDIPQGRISTTMLSTFGLRKQLWGTKASVNLMALDPFGVYRYRFETRDRTHVQTARTQPSIRRATLSFTYNFGRPPQSQRRSPTEQGQAAPDEGTQIR